MIKPPYGVPELLPMTAGIILKYLNSDPENKERLFGDNPWTFTRCKETIGDVHAHVGCFAITGLRVLMNKNYPLEATGIVAQLRLSSR